MQQAVALLPSPLIRQPIIYGDVVTLTATPAAGYTFAGWSGDLTGSTNPATVTMNAGKTITASFTQDNYTLSINTTGSGAVAKSPDQATYLYGDVVTLTATPVAGYTFAGWSGALSGSANPATLTMSGNRTVTATFTQIQYTLTANTDGHGTVALDPTGGTYAANTPSHFTPIARFGISVQRLVRYQFR